MNTTITGLQKALQLNAKKLGFDEPEDFRESLRFEVARRTEENRKLKEQLEEKKERLEYIFFYLFFFPQNNYFLHFLLFFIFL